MNWTAAQTFVLLLTLLVLLWYAGETHGIERASLVQSEGLSKPVLTVRCNGSTPAEVQGCELEIINIGNGPAIELSIKTERRRNPSQQSSGQPFIDRLDETFPYLEAKGTIPLRSIPRYRLDNGIPLGNVTCSVVCSYKSISSVEYSSTIMLDGRNVTNFEFCRKDRGWWRSLRDS
jgi:hypothetical protein